MNKLALMPGRIDGHGPLLEGRELDAYISGGIWNCHECSRREEALAKIRRGMHLLIREGSAARNLEELVSILTRDTSPFISFCADDRDAVTLLETGGIDSMVEKAIGLGVDTLAAYRASSWSAARAFGLWDRGLLAPGKLADIALLDSLEQCHVARVLKSGRLVDDRLFATRPPEPDSSAFRGSVKLGNVSPEAFRVRSSRSITPVIGVRPGTLITDKLMLELPLSGGEKLADSSRDILKAAVLERHGINGNIGLGFVKGFGLRRGAIASSVGHDSHNLCVVGVSDEDMALAANAVAAEGGGFAVAGDGRILARLPLPVGGLMSDLGLEELAAELARFKEGTRLAGCSLDEPMMMLAFMALPVIPYLKLTDRGLVDYCSFSVIEV